MFKRYAFFEGRILPGREGEFEAFVTTRLVPLWTRFPTATKVEILREVDADPGAPPYPMVLALTYPSLEGIEEALASPVRQESRETTKELLAMFEGRVFHTVFRLEAHATSAAHADG
jgi:hypothetical protein